MASNTVEVGAVQVEAIFLYLQAAVDKTIALIEQAGKEGVSVLGFLEVWIPGYPWSIWKAPVFKNVDFMHEYMTNNMARNSPEMDWIRAAVKKAGLICVLGYIERDGGNLYVAQSFIDPTGTIVLHRCKSSRRMLRARSGVTAKPSL